MPNYFIYGINLAKILLRKTGTHIRVDPTQPHEILFSDETELHTSQPDPDISDQEAGPSNQPFTPTDEDEYEGYEIRDHRLRLTCVKFSF